MGFFSRNRTASSRPAGSLPGRKLRTSLSLDEAGQMFEAMAREVGGYQEVRSASWPDPARPAPDAVWVALADGRAALVMAAWASHEETDLELVPMGNAYNLPAPMIGGWKMRDGSLTSTGTVTDFPSY